VPVSHIADRDSFTELLTTAVTSADDGHDKLQTLAVAIGLAADIVEARSLSESGELIDAFLDEFSVSSLNAIDFDAVWNELSVFPTEDDVWSNTLGSSSGLSEVGGDVYGASDAHLFPLLPIRKLGLQFLDLADYLQRNYELCRLEAAHDIRVDLEAAIKRVDAVRALQNTGNGADATIFRGFSPMVVPLSSPGQIVKVSKPELGKSSPSLVLARVELELSSRHRADAFDSYQSREVVYLVTVRATRDEAAELMGFQEKATPKEDGGFFPEEFGVVHVRAGELIEVTDGSGKVINSEESRAAAEGNDGVNTAPRGRTRVFKVALDGNQYKKDLDSGNLEAYEHANILIRRKPRENNFKSVLDTIMRAWQQSHHVNKRLAQRQVDGDDEDDHESAPAMVPTWLHDLVLGYGDPSSAQYPAILKARNHLQRVEVPLFEAIVDGKHAKEIADTIGCKLVDAADGQSELSPDHAQGPFLYSERVLEDSDSDMGEHKVFIKAQRRSNDTDASMSAESPVRFTPAQVEAIRAGSNEGLTLVVGPPGTGKTDVAVQLVLNLYRSAPAGEKILLVAHSNQALNDFFGKMLARQTIHESQIVRLGQAANAENPTPASELEGDFSASGRVTFLLQRRLELLNEVKYMAAWVEQRSASAGGAQGSTSGLGESASYSCENALYFYRMHMKSLVEQALAVNELTTEVALGDFYAKRNSTDPAAGPSLETLKQFAAVINAYFLELERLQPFELLHTARQRADMYLVHHARILVMTCTHAALNHRRLADLGLTIGSVVMEEAAQVSEIDTLIPILLACARSSKTAALSGVSASSSLFSGNLKRLVLMGDPQQLPPVVKAQALKTYAHFDNSLFTRLLRLGVPQVVLNQQGRSRTELADVYRWRYHTGSDDAVLGDLPRVSAMPQFKLANPGFAFVGQLIDVAGCRERQSQPFAFENLEEAHFAVAVVKYMLAVGYAPSRITVLTTYNAQRELLQRLLHRDTSSGKGKAICKVSTVDNFQGQQNDFIVLSTVRSGNTVGHLRDIRRASTALSRARLGLYVLGRRETLSKSKELAPFIEKLEALAPSNKSGGLVLVPSERVDDGFSRSAVAASGNKTKKGALTTVTVSSVKELDEVIAEVTKSGKKAAK
jgi:intron-binding protein aquarius